MSADRRRGVYVKALFFAPPPFSLCTLKPRGFCIYIHAAVATPMLPDLYRRRVRDASKVKGCWVKESKSRTVCNPHCITCTHLYTRMYHRQLARIANALSPFQAIHGEKKMVKIHFPFQKSVQGFSTDFYPYI